MAHPHTTPTVITDRNGKTTTVHRKNYSPAAPTGIPAVALRFSIGKSVQQELDELSEDLRERARSWKPSKERAALTGQTLQAVNEWRIDTLRVLERFATRGRNADRIAEACLLLREFGEEPDQYLTERHVDAVIHIQKALELWEMRYDNYKGGNIERRSEGREAIILYVLEAPDRDVLVDQALRRGAADLNEVMEYEEANRNIHRGIMDGSL